MGAITVSVRPSLPFSLYIAECSIGLSRETSRSDKVLRPSTRTLRYNAGARFGIINCAHAAIAIVSYGKPSFVVGADSRARMTEMIGLKSMFVTIATTEYLKREAERLALEAAAYAKTLDELTRKTESDYLSLLSSALPV